MLLVLFRSRITQEIVLSIEESVDNRFVDFICALSVVLLEGLHFDFEFIAVRVCPDYWSEEEFKTFLRLKLSLLIEEDNFLLPLGKGVEKLLDRALTNDANRSLTLRDKVEYSPSEIR